MALSAEIKMAVAIIDPLGRGLRLNIQLQDDVLGVVGSKTVQFNDPELFAQVAAIIQSYIPYIEGILQVPTHLPGDLGTANTTPNT